MVVTIRDVAKAAQVSKSTVSRVLNKVPCVQEQTRERVLRVAQELGYTPNAMARGLMTRRSKTVGLIMSDITNPFFPEIARGVEDIMKGYDYNVILCNTDGRSEKEAAYIKLLFEKRVDGIIFTSVRIGATDLTALKRKGLPFVLAGRALPGLEADLVIVDNILGGFQATLHLLELGYRKIAHITGPPGVSAAHDRQKGYEKALRQFNIEPDPTLVVEGDFTQHGGYKATKMLLSLGRRPQAAFAANDMTAIGALEAIYEEGLRVPEDISLVGFDDIPLARLHTIQLTTMAQPKYELGSIAARLLLERIDEERKGTEVYVGTEGASIRPPQSVILPPRLRVRKTCGAYMWRKINAFGGLETPVGGVMPILSI